jgi:hypothetical protein
MPICKINTQAKGKKKEISDEFEERTREVQKVASGASGVPAPRGYCKKGGIWFALRMTGSTVINFGIFSI